jgi:biopolymer transport protein TolQ
VVVELSKRHQQRSTGAELLSAVAKRALATEQQRATSLMATLSSIAAASPFVGLFGTVWGIMQAFLRIGVEKSASLPVVAPAIGEALIATAVGLVAAIPATIAYNYVDKRIGDLLEEVSSSSEAWVQVLSRDPAEGAHSAPHAQAAYGYQRR